LLFVALWLLDLVGVALIGTNVLGEHRQQQLSQSLVQPSRLLLGSKRQLPFATTSEQKVATAIGQLQIPALSLSTTVVEGAELPQLTFGPGHLHGTALPGQAGNAVIAGHRTTWGRPFAHLDALHRGDRIIFTNFSGRSTYVVTTSFVVGPNDSTVTNASSANVLTLLTCTPPHFATHRLIVRAALISTVPSGPAGALLPLKDLVMAPPKTSISLLALLTISLIGVIAFFTSNKRRPRRRKIFWVLSLSVVALTTFNLALVQHLPAGF
jgi:LPXTG-site transpeptidase (sortase) family protein